MRVSLFVIALLLLPSSANAQPDLWPMKAHDARRTSQSLVNGPFSIDEARSWSMPIPAAAKLNIGATVTEDAVVFGSWGLQRRDPQGRDQRFWDKADGQLFGLHPRTGAWRWGGPRDLDLTPRCYEYEGRGPNPFWCGFRPYEVSYYNGTVEGQPAYDGARDVLYVGRGDGKLYAVDATTGTIRWRYVTYNPSLPSDPDGGGEIITAPLLAKDGTVFFGTWGEGSYETNAFYAVSPDGDQVWRWPEATSLPHRFYASPALSPDGATVYASTFTDAAPFTAASLYAFDARPGAADRVKASLTLQDGERPVFTTTLAVGSDGVVYVGGYRTQGFGTVPVVAAVRDNGPDAPMTYVWPSGWVSFPDGAQFTHGIALREVRGETVRLFVTTANLGMPPHNGRTAGDLYAVDPTSGTVLARYDPSDDDPQAVGSLTSPAIGANGTVYVGVRGRFGRSPINGQVLAVDYDERTERFTRRWRYVVEGHIEWNHPAIGHGGGLFIGASNNAHSGSNLTVYAHDAEPEDATCQFYGLYGISVIGQ